jgi:hypothetical protein
MTSIAGIVPYVQCNREAHEEPTIEGLKNFLGMTGTCVVTTVPGNADVYSIIQAQVPRMGIIRGLKVHALLKDNHASPEGWRRVRGEVVACLEDAEDDVFVIDAESAMHPVWTGEQAFDADKLVEAIVNAAFPQDVTYYWGPSVPSRNEVEQLKAELICRAAQESFANIVFINAASLSGPRALSYPANVRVAGMLREFANETPAHMLQFQSRWWQDAQAPEAIRLATFRDTGCALLHTGQGRWVEASQSIPAALIDAGLIPRVRG